jgi:hypothetical protein
MNAPPRIRLLSLVTTLLAASCCLGWLDGCSSPAVPGASRDLLSFLAVEGTTRDTVLLRLGEPSAFFENGRILAYRVGEDRVAKPWRGIESDPARISQVAMQDWSGVAYSLVLVFDEHGALEKQSLVRVN